ncbi:MAG TPA: ATP-binding protein, partial [Anaerolineae bacterium]|nr:ATP-binding protein [Anaerolineae bacterium]
MIKPAPTPSESMPIGRQREMSLLWGQFNTVLKGDLRVALLSGEPGIGKSHLLAMLAAQADQAGAIILRGGASEAEGMPPYLPFLEALGQYIRSTPAEVLRQQTGAAAAILATILPELILCLGDL